MKTKITTTASLLAAAAALLATGTAAAQDRSGERDGPFSDGQLTRAEAVQMAEEMFDNVDANSDGYVSKSEAEEARERAKARMEQRRTEFDRERRGRRGEGGRGKRDDMASSFERRDTDDDGFISRAEAEEAALARFDKADADGDGVITRDEMRRGRGRGGRR